MANHQTTIKIGIIGGTGINDPKILQNPVERKVETIFGKPSDALIEGLVEGIPCVFLARHGRDHSIMPSNVNYRANIWALKELGCTHVIASSACGGLQEYTQPGDFLILDQFYDRTFGREQSFYTGRKPCLEGVLHIPVGEPFCEETRKVLIEACRKLTLTVWDRDQGVPPKSAHPCVHTRGSGLTINGPRFSSRLESQIHQSWGIDTVNMTLIPEVVLAREAGLSYSSMAIVTDYDSWKLDAVEVSVDNVLEEFRRCVDKVKNVFIEAVKLIAQKDWTNVIKANQARFGAQFTAGLGSSEKQ
ncbi:S-methyl-5'-thioadenosine phosphorylase [Fasciola gigantica]|uniref:S-methyl-5'-thioadenosine phosphorylase n=1 Tax=Fasciola gigantica TaxID=46835 RepID=A0A504Z0R6_FASGI|nr:S-methyl-5'-thioadenosine phosphorylase [Fasciola gigantica]